MTEKIPPRFRKTKTDKWAVMAPVEDLERALANGGQIEVLKRSGDWSKFNVASLGRPFDVDGVSMCYGYGPDDQDDASEPGQGHGAPGASQGGRQGDQAEPTSARPTSARPSPPAYNTSEPLPEFQGSAEDEWDGGF